MWQVKQHDRLRKDLQDCMDSICALYGIDSAHADDPTDFTIAMNRALKEAKEVRRGRRC
jgi:hypothetical protein